MSRPPRQTASAPLWVLSYGDMISLLLVFFIFVAAVKGARFERRRDAGRERGRHAHAAGKEEKPLLLEGLAPRGWTAGAPVLHTVLFPAGSAALGGAARDELLRLGPTLWSAPGPLVVAGYAAGRQAAGSRSAGDGGADWLAFARALAVCEFLGSDAARPPGADREAPFLPASGGTHGGSIPAHAAGFAGGRDRVDIYPLLMAGAQSEEGRR